MSSLSNNEEDESGLIFSKRTTNADFQQRLLKAQEEIEDDFEETLNIQDLDSSNDRETLEKELQHLQRRVKKNKKEITKLENKIQKQQEKRRLEASLTNLSPAERAKRVERELQKIKEKKEEEEEEPEMDTLFEYILFLSTDSEVGDLSKADFLQAHNDIRKKALQDKIVARESELSGVCFTEVTNIASYNAEYDITIRQCRLVGTSIGKPFSVSFNVTEPIKVVSNLLFDVGIEMQMDIGTLLECISEECDLLAFFRILIHYSKLESQRNDTIKRLKDAYEGGLISIEFLSESKLKFQGTGNNGLYVLLDWRIVEKTMMKASLDTDILENVEPVFEMEAVSILDDGQLVSDNMTNNLKPIVMERGVFDAINYFVISLLT